MADDARLRRRVSEPPSSSMISMLDARVLDAVDAACRAIRKSRRAVSVELQVVFVGFLPAPASRAPGNRQRGSRSGRIVASRRSAVCFISLNGIARRMRGLLGLLAEIPSPVPFPPARGPASSPVGQDGR